MAWSGGSSPVTMFDALAELDVPWRLVHVLQVDERVAPDGHEARNAMQLCEHLLARVAVPARQVHLMPVTSANLAGAAGRYARVVERLQPFDLVHLGLGDDGHTASWPPGDPVVDALTSVAVTGPFAGWRRMTLTPRPVNAARSRLVLASGSSKADVVDRWLLHDASLPIERVRRTGTTVVLDAEAARLGQRRAGG